jgi:hypothetical protein
MRNDSSLNYNTSNSKVQNFKDFEQNIRKEKDELKKLLRGYKTNKDGSDNIANIESDKLSYNKITHKMDSNFGKEIVDDSIDGLEDVEDTDHKFKMEKTQDKAKLESYTDFVQKKMMDQTDIVSDDTHVTSYMFFGNLQTIHRLCQEMSQLDESKVNSMLDDGHNWAEDHITTAKVQVSQVYNFLMNKNKETLGPVKMFSKETLTENQDYNYMFFANLERMMEQAEDLLQVDEKMVDDILKSGHDWAEDHVSSAKENVEQVHDFLTNEME